MNADLGSGGDAMKDYIAYVDNAKEADDIAVDDK